jgi:hypothetical protein
VRAVNCIYGMKFKETLHPEVESDPGFPSWLDAVRRLQQLNAEGAYRIMFFVNNVPPACPDGDVFYDAGAHALDEFYLRIMSTGTAAVSTFDEFLHMRPSQMPNARAHAIGNSNVVKADVLFQFLKAQPRLLERPAPPPRAAAP